MYEVGILCIKFNSLSFFLKTKKKGYTNYLIHLNMWKAQVHKKNTLFSGSRKFSIKRSWQSWKKKENQKWKKKWKKYSRP